jgi:hypothetical protein
MNNIYHAITTWSPWSLHYNIATFLIRHLQLVSIPNCDISNTHL